VYERAFIRPNLRFSELFDQISFIHKKICSTKCKKKLFDQISRLRKSQICSNNFVDQISRSQLIGRPRRVRAFSAKSVKAHIPRNFIEKNVFLCFVVEGHTLQLISIAVFCHEWRQIVQQTVK